MNCPNCGAPMQPSAKGLYLCGHCGTTAVPEPADRDGVRVVGASPGARNCPACAAPLVQALVDDGPAEQCQKCRGMLLPRRSFAEIVTRRRAWAEGPPVTPVPPRAGELRRTLACPSCGKPMIVDRYYGPGNIVMDSCPSCDLLWLDYGELKQVIDAPGPDRGTRDAT